MQKWEYKTLTVRKVDEHLLVEFLNDAGREGWEAIGNGVESSYNIGFYMKRPLVVEERDSHFLLFGRGTPLCENPEWTGWVTLEDKIHDVCPKCRSLKPNMTGL